MLAEPVLAAGPLLHAPAGMPEALAGSTRFPGCVDGMPPLVVAPPIPERLLDGAVLLYSEQNDRPALAKALVQRGAVCHGRCQTRA